MTRTFKNLYSFSKGKRIFFVMAVIATFMAVLFNFLSPQIIRFTVDSVIGNEEFKLSQFITNIFPFELNKQFFVNNLWVLGLCVIVCAIFSGIFNFLSRYTIATFTESTIKKLRDTLFYHTQHLPYAWHTKNQTGDTIQRCTSDIDVVRQFIISQLLEILRTVLMISVSIWLMFSMNVKLTLVALLFIPIVAFYSGYFTAKIRKKFLVCDEAESRLTVSVHENLSAVRVVRAFGREKYELEKFDKFNDEYANSWIKMGYINGAYWGIGDFVTGLQIVSIIIYGSVLAAIGELSIGEFIVFVSYNQSLAWPIRSLGRLLSNLGKTSISMGRINEILSAEIETVEPTDQKPKINGDISFKNVSFSYDKQIILDNISFDIKKGSVVGILGGTGSGKSTVAYLLNRLYELPQNSGTITVDGVDIKNIDRYYLRKNIGIVLQEPFLFSKTIAENIAVTQENINLDDIRACAKVASVDTTIMDFQNKYDTVVGERGVTLSGGQKQRVAIARTLMQNTPVIVFDDSMSAVDTETDMAIRKALKENTNDTTLILISHRINTLMQSDNILVLDSGKLVEQGTHSELMNIENGIYRRTYDMQSTASQDLIAVGGDD